MNKFSKYLAIGISLLLVIILCYNFRDIVAYLLIAWVLSLVGSPIMDFLEKKLKLNKFRWGRTLSTVLTIFILILFFVLLIGIFVPLIVEQARNLASVPSSDIAVALESPLEILNGWMYRMGLATEVHTASDQLQGFLQDWFNPQQIGNYFSSALGFAGSFFFGLFSIIFMSFFMLKERGIMDNIVTGLVPVGYENQATAALDGTTKLLTRYFGGIIIQITLITLFLSICLGIVGIKNAILIAFFAALINVIPYLGPIIGAIFATLLTISGNIDHDFSTEILPMIYKVLVVFGTMQLMDNFILQPFIFSNSVKAHPLEIFIIILMGAQIDGITGMILAIPVYTVLRVIGKVFLSEFKLVKVLTGGLDS